MNCHWIVKSSQWEDDDVGTHYTVFVGAHKKDTQKYGNFELKEQLQGVSLTLPLSGISFIPEVPRVVFSKILLSD